MGISFERFLRTGQLGPLTLGIDPASVEFQLGLPESRSRKNNPLLMKYGPLELTFWSPRSQPPQLAQIMLSIIHGLQGLPKALRFDDWIPDLTMKVDDFIRFMGKINLRPEEVLRGEREATIMLPSGLIASFSDNQLRALVLSKRARDENRQPILSDEREPSLQQIRQQLQEALDALRHGLGPAAMLLAWAALEAALRRKALHVGYKGKVRVQPTVLIRELYALRVLNSEQVQALESARQKRTAIAHGLTAPSVERDDVLQIVNFAEHLLSD